ncbi:DUF5050 domain-containing protein [Paenibacillus albidus]|uniref:DUF5050 domain-containing protein n=1 Tax=Paenibacillus albidus TaxID=2041023 RepID=UPI001BE56483|nr:DUF5050 domain-containing protein [Paenibacillus albidus]MBT2289012.1 DUF5050 domain-containing protein [Paenibacillus albidus]
MTKDGKNEKLISPAERYFITAGGKIYLGGFDGDLSKVSTDGTSFEQSFVVAEDAYRMPDITAVNMRGEYIYYYEKDDNRIRRVNRNGTGKSSFVTLPTDYSVNTINIAGNWMYYDAGQRSGRQNHQTQSLPDRTQKREQAGAALFHTGTIIFLQPQSYLAEAASFAEKEAPASNS